MTILAAQTYALTLGGRPLVAVDDSVVVRFDEGNAPWMTATAVVRRPSDDVFALLDPDLRSPVRLVLDAPASLTLAFVVQEYAYDPTAETVGLALVPDEYTLQTFAPGNPVALNGPEYQASARTLCSAVVSKALGRTVTVQLATGTTNVAVPVFAAAENVMQIGAVRSLTGYTATSSPAGRNGFILTSRNGVSTAMVGGFSDTTSVDVRNDAKYAPISPGTKYTAVMSLGGTGSMTVFMQCKNDAGTVVQQTSIALGAAPSSMQRYSVSFTAPAGATGVTFVIRASGSAGDNPTIYAGQISMTVGDGLDTDGALLRFFDGETPTGTNGYTYAWTGAANQSSSTRTPIVDRPPELLTWTSESTADEFLRPILEASGLRLFQDERGVFTLADNSYAVAGQVLMQHGATLYEGVETSSVGTEDADGFPQNADAVLITYTWTDPLGVERKRLDVALARADYSRPYVLTKDDTPFPGPGQARFLLRRLMARRRSISSAGRPDWSARPGMSAVVSLPSRPAAVGYTQALEFDLARARMTVVTKGLVTTPPGSIGNAPTTQRIGAVSGSIGAYTN